MKEMTKTESGLYVPKQANQSTKHLNIVRQGPVKRLMGYFESLIEADPQKGARRAKAIWSKVAEVVAGSFEPEVLPVKGEVTQGLQNERIDKCVEIILALADNGWVSTRIIDELSRIFFASLREGELKIPKRDSWGVKEDDTPVAFDYSQENEEHG